MQFLRDITNPNLLTPLPLNPVVTVGVPITHMVIDISDTKLFVLTLTDIRIYLVTWIFYVGVLLLFFKATTPSFSQ